MVEGVAVLVRFNVEIVDFEGKVCELMDILCEFEVGGVQVCDIIVIFGVVVGCLLIIVFE